MTVSPAIRLPVVTIGGFLGAGKTTLVNHILSGSGGRRIVVFVNDFGDINVDYDLVETIEEDRVSLKNGCVCCSLNEDLVAGIAGFARQETPPDAIVVETSGVADPRSLNQSMQVLEASGLGRLDCRLYILDAENFDALDYETAEAVIDHAAACDVILLNKIDIATPRQIGTLRGELQDSAPYSTVLETANCDIAPEVVFDRNGRDVQTASDNDDPMNQVGTFHSSRFSSWSYRTDRLFDRGRFAAFIEQIAGECLRAKGRLHFSCDPETEFVFHLVGRRATLERGNTSAAHALSELVFIGERRTFAPQLFRQGLRDAH